MIRLAVFGQPVKQSLSPRIHRLFAEQAGMAIRYEAIEAGPGALADALSAFSAAGGTGCNITAPLKHEALALAAHTSARAARAGAANTLWLERDGWSAETTDGAGLVRDLDRLGMSPRGKRLALLGAGGATAGVLAALLESGAASLAIYNRSLDRAEALAARHEDLGSVRALALETLGDRAYDLVINATSLGHQGERPPVTPALFKSGAGLYDLNYGVAAKPLETWCAGHGIAFASGLGMLVGQAAESFRLWTDFRPEVEPVLTRLDS